jgi:hypothetical protein
MDAKGSMVLASESERKTSFGLPGYLNVEGRLTLNDPGKKWKGTRAIETT